MEKRIQTRSETNGLQEYHTLQDALTASRDDDSIWKISFEICDGTRLRLVKTSEGWTYENVMSGSRIS